VVGAGEADGAALGVLEEVGVLGVRAEGHGGGRVAEPSSPRPSSPVPSRPPLPGEEGEREKKAFRRFTLG
jgi:hypothetical protein